MDKNAIKKYAVWARRELISRVSQKALQYGIAENEYADRNADSVNGKLLTAEEKHQRAALIEQINKNGYEQVMEEVAYTWFNRFCALRFMEVNGYLPTHIRVFTDDDNHFKPQILDEAINLNLPGLKLDKVYELKNENREEELFKYLIIVQCNALNSVLPGMFQKISDYTELLFPDNLLRQGSVVEQLVSSIPEEDWKDAVQIIGWLYQFYNIEPKDKVFENLKKNIKISKDNIPAATQLFTPDWIVRYMVENTLGKIWVEGHPDSTIKENWKYYVDDPKQEDSVQEKLAKIYAEYSTIDPKDLKCIDPCMGSGHILVYMFDVLVQIYGDFGYSVRDAVQLIVRNNIYGLDLDERAAQLAYFAVMMKARQYDRRFFERGVQPQIYAIQESNGLSPEVFDYIVKGDEKVRNELQKVVDSFKDAKEYGSILRVPSVDFELLYKRFDEIIDDVSLYQTFALDYYLPIVKQAEVLHQKYDVVVTNPPYMGSSGMDSKLSDFVKKNFPDSKSDLFAVFIEVCGRMAKKDSLYGMITQHAWMFLSSYENLRKKLLMTQEIVNMAHLGARAFEEIGGEVVQTTSFVIRNANIGGNGVYFRLVDSKDKEKDFVDNLKNSGGGRRFVANKNIFETLPGNLIAYWLSVNAIKSFKRGNGLGNFYETRNGFTTGNNDKFLRLWFEVSDSESYYTATDCIQALYTGKTWFPYNKGGDYKKWYGNQEYVINWKSDGKDIKSFGHLVPRSMTYMFFESISWSKIATGRIAFRYYPKGFMFDVAGLSMFRKNEKVPPETYIIGLMNSAIAMYYLKAMSPTMNFESGQIANVPIIKDENQYNIVSTFVNANIEESKQEWDSFETSWNFKKHPLI